ncbi:MAG: DUF4386 family protein [Chloroflexi bacterium]|nr:DUF4386 family protein [Chloroflexota bacterium]
MVHVSTYCSTPSRRAPYRLLRPISADPQGASPVPDLQRWGGIAALVDAAAFIFGIALLLTRLAPMAEDSDPVATAAFLVDNQATVTLWYLVIYLVFGAFLVVLALALHERLAAGSSALMRVATAFGLIWAGLMFASGMVANVGIEAVVGMHEGDPAAAAGLWTAVSTVIDGLGGGNEIVGGLWVAMLSWAALRAGGLPKGLTYLGLLVGLSGLVTVIPGLSALGIIFGLGCILWFLWLGVVLLRAGRSSPA